MKSPNHPLQQHVIKIEQQMSEPASSTTELLLLPDGQILVHNLTPAMAALLAEFNPADEPMRERANPPERPPLAPATDEPQPPGVRG